MKSKEDAIEILDKYLNAFDIFGLKTAFNSKKYDKAKKLAISMVDQNINLLMSMKCYYDVIEVVDNVKYWQEVKKELENL